MKLNEIALQYGFDETDFRMWAINSQKEVKVSFFSETVDENSVPKLAELYMPIHQAEIQKKADKEKEKREQQEKAKELELLRIEKQDAIAEMLVTSGFNFDGYKIVKYSGYISGDDTTQISSIGFNNPQMITDSLVKLRIQALKELKEAAYDLGCNAVIGVDFDYLTLEPSAGKFAGITVDFFIIAVTANGNAVIIEKE